MSSPHPPYLQAALTAYEDARTDGLCHDGAWECALAAARATQSVADMPPDFAQRLALYFTQKPLDETADYCF